MDLSKEYLIDLIVDLVASYALRHKDGALDSGCISTMADAMRLLASIGILEIERDVGRCVIARWTEVRRNGQAVPQD